MMRLVRAVTLQSWWRGIRISRAYRRGKWRDWVEIWNSGRVSYVNMQTGATSRFKPTELTIFGGVAAQRPNKSGWVETWDVTQQSHMYYHVERKEYRWQKPSDFDAFEEEHDDEEESAKLEDEDEIMQLSMLKRDAALPNLDTEAVAEAVLARSEPTGRELSEWIEMWDKKIAHCVWQNAETGKLSWDAPNRSELSNTGMRTGRKMLTWEQLVDESSGESYYVNTKTGEISFERPSNVANEWFQNVSDKRQLTDRSERTGRHHFQWQEYVFFCPFRLLFFLSLKGFQLPLERNADT